MLATSHGLRTIFRSVALGVQPLTLTVERAATVLEVARSTATSSSEPATPTASGSGAVQVATLAERLGVTSAEILASSRESNLSKGLLQTPARGVRSE